MKAVKMNVFIGSDRRLAIDLPQQIQEGPAELILLCLSDKEAGEADSLSNRIWIESILHSIPAGKSIKDIAQ